MKKQTTLPGFSKKKTIIFYVYDEYPYEQWNVYQIKKQFSKSNKTTKNNLPVTSRFPGPACEVSTRKVTGFPTIPFLHSLTWKKWTLLN